MTTFTEEGVIPNIFDISSLSLFLEDPSSGQVRQELDLEHETEFFQRGNDLKGWQLHKHKLVILKRAWGS